MGNLAFLHGGNIHEAKRRHKKDVIDFSANINPLGLPTSVKKAIYNFDSILHYPDPQAKDITHKIAKYWGIKEENVLVGNGSIELIYLIMSSYKPKTVLIPAPTFSDYERAARCVNSRIRFLKLKEKKGFKLDPPRLNNPDMLFLCNPNNPTGNLTLENPTMIRKFAARMLVIDEAFMDFLERQKNYTLVWQAVRNKRIIVLRTFTKFFALPGLRIGYLIAHQENIHRLRKCQPPWSTNSLAQSAAEAILKNKKYTNETLKLIKKERGFLVRRLSQFKNLKLFPSLTNFLLIKIKNARITSKSLKKLLLKKGILIRDCSNFRNLNNKYIRIAIRSRKENLRLLSALKKVL